MGEASNNLPKSINEKYLQVPWNEMYLMRNKISHQYFGTDYEIIWDVPKNHLPKNKKQIEEILNSEEKH